MASPKVSVVVTAHNYAKYLEACLNSAVNQTYDDYEVVVVDDGSTDETPEILREYTYEYPDLFTTVRLSGEGLPTAANAGIDTAEGEYVVRLDADDYFDENILTVLSNYLDANPDIDLVYPDYYTFDDGEDIINHVRLPEVGEEIKLLNRSPLAAGAMYRKSAWEQLGGYNESLDYQEDYDFWIRFISEFDVRNVNLPLMYYRQHGESMSTNLSGRLDARRSVKREFVETKLEGDLVDREVLAVIPARTERRIDAPDGVGDPLGGKPLALYELCGRPLIEYTIEAALEADRVDKVTVSTESEAIAEVARHAGAEVPALRPERLAATHVELAEVVANHLDVVAASGAYEPDVVAILPYVSPLRTAAHVDEALDTKQIFSVDSVIGVEQNKKFLWQPGKFGLEPLFEERLLREEKEGLYQENGGLYVTEPSVVRNRSQIIGEHVGHVLMQRHASVHVDSWLDLSLCERVLETANETETPVSELENDDD
ncbi:glycosyltransferase [Halomicroarcula sp. GCM10025817]|uniref:glycosyltransferase n=1 Tax=Haloarcula TaxID=2237 RepID=UPI0023E784C1|nr:glycosyltransferase [Halomicroarcula sp. SYNS111]